MTEPTLPAQPPFVDAHHHLWDLHANRYAWLAGDGVPETTAWLGDYAPIRRPYGIDQFLADAAGTGLVKSVHVQAGWTGGDPVGETRWLQAIADERGFPHAIVADVDLREPDAEANLERHAECPNLRGVRMLAMSGLVDDPAFRRGFRALARRGLSYDLNTTPATFDEARRLARAFHDTTMILGNAGNPRGTGEEAFRTWRAGMTSLAQEPNVVVKISGLGMNDHRWTVDSLRPVILSLIEIFGVDRCMLGSNWPVDGLYSSYAELIDAYRVITGGMSDDERTRLFRGNAERCYRI